MMRLIENKTFDEERALYGERELTVKNCRFDGPADGESALKECEDITVLDSFFNLRYPFWHVNRALIRGCEMTELCRAALWYDDEITIRDCRMNGIKAFRECSNIRIYDSDVTSPEFLWRCCHIDIRNVSMVSEYPFFESRDITIENLRMKGKYSFQYVENMTIRGSDLDTKDAFWHSKNVTVTDSIVRGEYLGWYSENLRLVRCKIIGTQPLCYCKGLVLEDCETQGCDLSFERSEVQASIRGRIEGIKNPLSGQIRADEIGELLIESRYADPQKTEIRCDRILNKILDR